MPDHSLLVARIVAAIERWNSDPPGVWHITPGGWKFFPGEQEILSWWDAETLEDYRLWDIAHGGKVVYA